MLWVFRHSGFTRNPKPDTLNPDLGELQSPKTVNSNPNWVCGLGGVFRISGCPKHNKGVLGVIRLNPNCCIPKAKHPEAHFIIAGSKAGLCSHIWDIGLFRGPLGLDRTVWSRGLRQRTGVRLGHFTAETPRPKPQNET